MRRGVVVRLFPAAVGGPGTVLFPDPLLAGAGGLLVGGGLPALRTVFDEAARLLAAHGLAVEVHLHPWDPSLAVGIVLPQRRRYALAAAHPHVGAGWLRRLPGGETLASPGEPEPVREGVRRAAFALRRAADALAEHDRLEVACGALDRGGVAWLAAALAREWLAPEGRARRPLGRDLFLSAATAEGTVDLGPPFGVVGRRRVRVTGSRLAVSTLLVDLRRHAGLQGLDTWAFHHPVAVPQLTHLYVPAAGLFLGALSPEGGDARRRDRLVDLAPFTRPGRLAEVEGYLAALRSLAEADYLRALAWLAEARAAAPAASGRPPDAFLARRLAEALLTPRDRQEPAR